MEADVSGYFSPQIRTLGLEPAPPLAWLAVAPTPPQWGELIISPICPSACVLCLLCSRMKARVLFIEL